MSEKKFSELVLEEREKGNVVYLALDEIISAPIKEIIKQPTEGLLWDLNRDEVTALTFMDREGKIHWVNNFAVALVIKELKSQLAQLEGLWIEYLTGACLYSDDGVEIPQELSGMLDIGLPLARKICKALGGD